MKIRALIFLFLSVTICGTLPLFSQDDLPPHWDSIVASPWFFGNVNNKPVFLWLESAGKGPGYFFMADKAIPDIITVNIKWKGSVPRSAGFVYRGQKIRLKFTGSFRNDTLAGYIKTSRSSAVRLSVPPELPVLLVKEKPSYPPALPPRYRSQLFRLAPVMQNISFGAATGHYVSMPVKEESYDYQQIIFDAFEKMYVNPTKEAILHIFNQDPVSFAVTDLQPLRLDLYQPDRDTLDFRPLIVMLHGGAFIIGDKATPTVKSLAEDFARKGYVVASINYRIGFNPASRSSLERAAYRAVQDARAALRFLSAHAQEYRIDPDCVFLAGSSAGAITALNAAFMKEDERPESTGSNIFRAQKDLGGLDESTNTVTGNYKIRAVVNLWGAVNDTLIIDPGENIPVLSIHGDADRIVPYDYNYPFLDLDTSVTSNILGKLYGSKCIDSRMKNLGFTSELITLKSAGHEPQFEPGQKESVMSLIQDEATNFLFHSFFGFPSITGPAQIAYGTAPTVYSVLPSDNVACYWHVQGGKRVPGDPDNQARIAWTGNGIGKVTLVLVHKNLAVMELRKDIEYGSAGPDIR